MINVYICSTQKDLREIRENAEDSLLYALKTHFEDKIELKLADAKSEKDILTQISKADIVLIYLTDNFCMKEEVKKLILIIENEHVYKYAIFPVIINRLTTPTKDKIKSLLFTRHIFPNEQTALTDFSDKKLENELKNIVEEFGKLIKREEEENETYLQLNNHTSQAIKIKLCENYLSQYLHGKFRNEVLALYNNLKPESDLENQWQETIRIGTIEAVNHFLEIVGCNNIWRTKALERKKQLEKEFHNQTQEELAKLDSPQSYYAFLDNYPNCKEYKYVKSNLLKLIDKTYASIEKNKEILVLESFLNDFPRMNLYAKKIQERITHIINEQQKKENEAFLKASIQAHETFSALPMRNFLINNPNCSEECRIKANALIEEMVPYKPLHTKIIHFSRRYWKKTILIIILIISCGYFLHWSFTYHYGWAGIRYIYPYESNYIDMAKYSKGYNMGYHDMYNVLYPYDVSIDSFINKSNTDYTLLYETLIPFKGNNDLKFSSPQMQSAVTIITKLANKGIPEAMYLTGNISLMQKDTLAAEKYFRQSIEKDYYLPLHNLSNIYRDRQDTLSQIKILKKILEVHFVEDQLNSQWKDAAATLIDISLISSNYKDDTLAFELLKKYTHQLQTYGGGMKDDYKKCLTLAQMYLEGIAVRPDTVQTYQIASRLQIPEAYFLCGYLLYNGFGTKSVDFEKAAQSYEKILSLVPRGELRDKALYNTAWAYLCQWNKNYRTEKKSKDFDVNKVTNYLKEAKKNGCQYSANLLGFIYSRDEFLNVKETIENLEQAMQSTKTAPSAYFNLGILYYFGKFSLKGVFPHDKEKGEYLLKKAGEMGVNTAEEVLNDKRWWNFKKALIW